MKALVTGAEGFVGPYLIDHLKSVGDQPVGTSLGNECDVSLDITDPKQCREVVSDVQPDVIYHLAGISYVVEAEDNINLALAINVGGTANLAAAAGALEKPVRFVMVSTGHVYGEAKPEDMPLTESSNVQPSGVYALTKFMAEQAVDYFDRIGAISAVVLRPFNHTGPKQPDDRVISSFAKQLAEISAGKREPVIEVGNLEAKRDFSDVRDIVRGYRMAAEKGSGVYNLGSGTAVAVQEILDTLIEISGLQVEVRQDPARMRPSDTPILSGSIEKAKEELGWEPSRSLKETLESVYQGWR